MSKGRILLFIIALLVVALVIDMPATLPLKFQAGPVNIDTTLYRPVINTVILGKPVYLDFALKQGLDLKGGTHVVLQADMSQIDPADRAEALASSKEIISRRVDLFGVSEPLIQTAVNGDDYRLIVELAGVTDINQALDLIGRTAQLDFRELPPDATEAADFTDFVATGLTGKNLKKAAVQFGQTGEPEVNISFDGDGAAQFAAITQRNLNKPVAIFLDEIPVTWPRVNQAILDGNAVISGQFTLEQAKGLAIQLNAGALPVPIQIIEQKNIGATLGQASVQKSLTAGLIGLEMVMLFMILYYGWLGFISSLVLILYALITLALYKLIPVTLTLPGLAGFLLSVGMAVDSNILIFERMKEEIRAGKSRAVALELGFGRAWDSIKDANVATLITAFILFNPFNWNFLNTSGMIRGFALTLSLGILISLFTGIIVTRTLLRLFYRVKS